MSVAFDSIHDCFLENITLTKVINHESILQWYAKRNQTCKELGLGKSHCNSVPLNLPLDQIQSFFKEATVKSEPWKAMKLVVLGHGCIGKSTLVQKLKDYINPVWFLYHFILILFHVPCYYWILTKTIRNLLLANTTKNTSWK